MSDTRATVHRLLHTLWTRAVGTSTYVKADWTELDNGIRELVRQHDALEDRLSRAAKYAAHPYSCGEHGDPPEPCSCGLDAVFYPEGRP